MLLSHMSVFFVCGNMEEEIWQRERMVTMSVYLHCSRLPGWTSLPVSVEWFLDQKSILVDLIGTDGPIVNARVLC